MPARRDPQCFTSSSSAQDRSACRLTTSAPIPSLRPSAKHARRRCGSRRTARTWTASQTQTTSIGPTRWCCGNLSPAVRSRTHTRNSPPSLRPSLAVRFPKPPMSAPAFLQNQLELGSSLSPTPGNPLDYSTKPHYASWNSAGQTISRRSKCLMQSRRR
jgi:hypothetical protein